MQSYNAKTASGLKLHQNGGKSKTGYKNYFIMYSGGIQKLIITDLFTQFSLTASFIILKNHEDVC